MLSHITKYLLYLTQNRKIKSQSYNNILTISRQSTQKELLTILFIMSFCQIYIFLFLLFFVSCNALRCTTNCTFTYNFTESFQIPEQCNQIESAGKCSVRFVFYYNRQEYFFTFEAISSPTIFQSDNKQHAKLHLTSLDSAYLSYYIDRACKDKDDCARDIAIHEANKMLQRQIDVPNMIKELKPLMIGPSLLSPNTKLLCYDANEVLHECTTVSLIGICGLSNKVSGNKISRSCSNSMREIFVSMYRSGNDDMFDFQCDESLCNNQTTLQNIKRIMFEYNVTKTLDGRLDGSRLVISISLIIMTMFTLLFNHF